MNDYTKFKTALLFDHVPPFLSIDFPLLEQCKIIIARLTDLHFNGIFHLNFLKELLIVIDANFSHLLHCPCFLLRFVKKYASQKALPTTEVYAITLTCIKIEEKTIPLCWLGLCFLLYKNGYFMMSL